MGRADSGCFSPPTNQHESSTPLNLWMKPRVCYSTGLVRRVRDSRILQPFHLMKLRRILAQSFVFLVSITPLHANSYWDGTDTTADADGGSGVWDFDTLNWKTAATGGNAVAWLGFQTAHFGGAAGTVTIDAGGVTASDLFFNTTGYTVQGGALGMGGGLITTAPGVETNLAAPITGAGGITKAGGGTLVFAGANTYTGTTTVSAGTLKTSAAQKFRYYRFTVGLNSGGDGYNQLAELHYYQNGAWLPAPAGSSNPSGTGEQNWNNANDNLGANLPGFTKFGSNPRPYWLTYDFGSPVTLDAYNWATANDSTPARNPRRWTVSGSNDGTNFTVIDDRSYFDQVGPASTYTWSGTAGPFETNTNSLNGGAANAFPLRLSSVPAGSPLVIASGATFDLNGLNQTSPTLSDLDGGGGAVTNSATTGGLALTLNSANSATFSGTIGDSGPAGALSLIKLGTGTQTLAGSASNTYSGTTTLGGSGRLVLAKTGGAISIPGNVNLSSNAFGGNNAGLVLAGDEQIADTAVLTWTPNGFGLSAAGNALAPQADTFFRLNGHTETLGGLVTSNTSGFPAIENRGNNDTAAYGAGKLIINVAGSNVFTYSGQIRDTDASTNGLGGTVSLTKTGTGTQVLAGTMAGCSGPTLIEEGILRINNLLGSTTVSVTGSGILQGTGTLSGLVTVQAGGLLSPGVSGSGTLTTANPATIGDGGTLAVSGTTLNGSAVIASGGLLTGVGSVSGVVTVQAGGQLAPGTGGIGTLNTNSSLNLAGTTTMEIHKAGAVLTADRVNGFVSVTYGGTLAIVATGDAPQLGDSYQLFAPTAGGTYSGAFSSITGLPALPVGLQWETTSLLATGRINVIDTASPPAFGPVGGGYVGAQSVTITSDSGSTIYYTLDGSEPTLSSLSGNSPISGIEVPVDSALTVKAFAVTPGFADSAVATAVYRTVTVPKWNVDANGDWSTATNWINEVIPNGSGATADFTLAQTANRTVTLNASRILGRLVFANDNPFPWTLASSGGSVLTLDVPSGKPEIEVLNVDTTISSVIAGSQGFIKTGPGTLSLTGTNTFSGILEVNGGRLSVDSLLANGSNSRLGSGSTLSLNGGTLRYTGAANIGFGTFNRAIVLGENGGTIDTNTQAGFWFTAGSFSGPGSFTKVGSRQLILQSNSSYDGITYINEGELQIRTLTALGSTVGKTVVNSPGRLALGQNLVATIGETLELNGFGGGNGAFQCNDGGVIVNWTGPVILASESGIGGASAFTISGPISGDANLVKLVSNTITLSGAESNTYTGTTTLGGTGRMLLAKTDGAIAIPGNINLSSTAFGGNNSGIVLAASEQIADQAVLHWTTTAYGGGVQQDSFFRLNGHSETIGGLVSTGNGAKVAIENRGFGDATTYGEATLILNTLGTNVFSYNGNIRDMDGGTGGGSIALVKSGTGTQILSGTLANTGATTILAGTLQVDGLAASAITVKADGTLKGIGATSNTLTVEGGATLSPGQGVGTFSAGATTLAGTYACELDALTGDRLTVNGTLDVTGATLAFDALSAPTADSYVIASHTVELTGTFNVTGLPDGYEMVYDEDAGEVRLDKVLGGFAAFAKLNGLSGVPDADFDNDGLADAVEYVLGTSPIAGNAGGPSAEVLDGNLVFTFTRDHQSLTSDIEVAVQVGDDLTGWPGLFKVGVDTESSDDGVVVTKHDTNDTITLTVEMAPDTTKFARLQVTVTP